MVSCSRAAILALIHAVTNDGDHRRGHGREQQLLTTGQCAHAQVTSVPICQAVAPLGNDVGYELARVLFFVERVRRLTDGCLQ